ncbi:hypothetical protein HAX54_052151 [Datura stramonium]|uniref:Myb-like domain-containing protein n=1 Tax=Datura stramonium TaxID=4076 RepID=A0ABS8SZ87_DATST|nr:hypothetical protein [Datura stramonium]
MNNIDDTGNINIVGDNEEQSRKKNNVPTSTEKKINNIHKAANDVILNEKYKPKRKRGRKATNQGESQNNANKTVTRKCYTVWTMDLHKKFMEAVDQLGDGRCCPVEILEVMNVPGLTRLQVASHLQKCRNNNWRAPKERKSTRQLSGQLGSSGESSTQQQVCHPQLQVDPQYLISLDNPVLSPAENNDSSALQRQHEPLVGMLGSQESITGSTYYKSGMELNDGDLHAQNNYDWKVEAYSMMFDTDVENVTVNDLGVENANFQQYICEPNISHPNNIITTSHVSYTEGNDSYERENYDPYLDFIDIDSLFENHESPSSNLPNGHDSEFDQVFCDD